MRKIVLTTIGTLGDLHPFIAIAQALRRHGFAPVLAVAEDQLAKCRAAGIEAAAVLPGFDSVQRRLGLAEDEAVKRIMGDQIEMLDQVLLPALPACIDKLETVAAGAEAIIASTFVFAAPIVAEKHGIPLISVVLQPMAILSAYDPPCTPDFWMMKHAPNSVVGRLWNRAVYGTMRVAVQLKCGPEVDRARAAQRLPRKSARRLLEASERSALTLATYSRHFSPLPPDAPANARLVGFPIFDSQSGAEETLDPALAAFLADGPAPIIFTLGSFAVHCPGNFYAEAAAAARALGRRAVLLTGHGAPRRDGDIFRCAYAPHSLLFPAAAAVVHHGGAGTTGQALRAGKPQLVVPHMGDQYDHGQRIERLGVGLSMKAHRFTATRAARMIARLLDDPAYAAAAARIGAQVARENGADAAAAAIAEALGPARAPARAFVPRLAMA
ncbi:glycosyltransferase [Sphingomonas sp. H39-1-10]|uniref:glycosyltransferase n=1 Tax=Sphingomonas pollutisoli TaxID=3030829 RepID=UPI0023B9225A|nr:glycosyltransferase [Sphingomonas pollutisoli]MDF0486871.1 glycosyltransferase [Sphingomonas pollutisoli]